MTAVSQKEYLKKYLSVGDDKPKKKKKKKQVASKRNVMIFDDDVDFKSLQPSINQGLQEAFEDEAPTVAEVIDERPKEEVLLEAYRKSKKWKVINKNGEGTDKGISTDVTEKKSRHRIRHDSDSDMSPQRSSAPSKTGTPNLKPYSSKSHRSSGSSKVRPDSDSDQSPVRNRSKVSGNSLTVESKNMREGLHSESDLSPERTVSKSRKEEVGKQKHNQRHDSDSDISPVRTSRRHDSDSDISPVRTSRRHDSDSDLSPERPSLKDNVSNQTKIAKSQLDKQKELKNQNKRRHDSDSDLSPPRKAQERRDSDLPPPRGNESDSDLSPDRRKSPVGSDSDLSPPRQRDKDESRGRKKATKTLAGTSAGLQDAATLKRENEDARQRQAKMFDSLDDEVLGKNAKTIFRDRSGKKRNLQEEKQKEKEEAAKVEKENEKFVQWGKGLAQKQQHEAAVADALHEMSKPLARYQDDKDLDAILRDQDREGDPMLAFIRKKESKQKEKAGIKEKPKYKGPPGPPNRFNIPPGYRWDGVDRSNGFEKKFFTRMSDKRAMEEVKYKWSVEDM